MPSLSDDEAQSAVMKAAQALGTMRAWLEKQLYDEGGEDEGEE